jgi:hypothetical protein
MRIPSNPAFSFVSLNSENCENFLAPNGAYLSPAVVSTLQEFTCFAADVDGMPVNLGTCAAFTGWGAEQVATRKLTNLTKIKLWQLKLTRKSPVWAEVRSIDPDFERMSVLRHPKHYDG